MEHSGSTNCGSVTLGSNITYSGNEWPLIMDIKTFLDASSTIPSTGIPTTGSGYWGAVLMLPLHGTTFPE